MIHEQQRQTRHIKKVAILGIFLDNAASYQIQYAIHTYATRVSVSLTLAREVLRQYRETPC